MSTDLSITFFFPYREVSGVPVLFARMARHLSQRGVDVRVADYRDGYMFEVFERDGRVRVLPFDPGRPFRVGRETLLVMQAILPYTMRPELQVDPDTRLVFWTLHPLNWVPAVVPGTWFRNVQARHPTVSRWMLRSLMPALRRELAMLLQDLGRKRSVVFMDGATLRSTCELLGVRIEQPEFLPVACDVPPENRRLTAPRARGDEVAFGWLGRLSDFKTHVLLYTMERLAEHATRTRTPIVMHIIGAGPDEAVVRRRSPESTWFRVVQVGVRTGTALDAYLLTRVDVLAAMGASALEGAKLGVPTVLLDPFYGPVPKTYRFQWLFESTQYRLGDLVWSGRFRAESHDIDDVLEAVGRQERELSARTYEYCRRYHTIEAVTDWLIEIARGASFHYRDFRPAVLRKGLIRKGYEFFKWATRISS